MYVSHCIAQSKVVFSAFSKLRKATISFVTSVRPSVSQSVRREQLGSHRTDFHEVLYLVIFRETVEKILVSLQSDRNNG